MQVEAALRMVAILEWLSVTPQNPSQTSSNPSSLMTQLKLGSSSSLPERGPTKGVQETLLAELLYKDTSALRSVFGDTIDRASLDSLDSDMLSGEGLHGTLQKKVSLQASP